MIPIFVIVRDRITVLKQSMESWYKNIDHSIEIILLDQESTYPPMLDFLKEKQKEGIRVEYLKNTAPIPHKTFPAIASPIYKICEEMKVDNYVLSDPDIILDDVDGDILDFYLYFMKMKPGFKAIGPMLRIDDIPDYYPFKNEVLTRHSPFWQATGEFALIRPKEHMRYKNKTVSYQISPIDTTFSLRNTKDNNGTGIGWTASAVRTREPYIGRHLDWYIDPDNLSDDQKYYIDTSNTHKGISHWAGTWMKHPESLARAKPINRTPKRRGD